jgi:hypothetical protein
MGIYGFMYLAIMISIRYAKYENIGSYSGSITSKDLPIPGGIFFNFDFPAALIVLEKVDIL